jgi:predicted lipoprotein with Yx(FWY)xxD motif
MTPIRIRSALATSLMAVALLAACGSSSSTSSSTVAAAATTAAPAATTAAAATTVATTTVATTAVPATTAAPATTAVPATTAAVAASDAAVQLVDNPLGTILVDGKGMTLYLFTKDTATTSNCAGACLTAWPPLTATSVPKVGTGLDAASFTLADGAAGTKLLTFNGHPLYYFAKDTKPGDTTGQKVGGVWFVLDAKGNPIGAA